MALRYAMFMALLCVAPWAMADTYELDGSHTYAYFRIKHFDKGFFTGVFKEVKGSFRADGKDEAKPEIKLTIDVDSLDSFHPKRNDHLLGPDFFNAKRFKQITFTSSEVKKVNEQEYQVTGELSMHGVTKTVKGKVVRGTTGKDPWGGHRTGGNVYLTIDRTDFGIKHSPEPAIGHKVDIDLYFEALRK
ncbi:MAG: YceI family protein [Zetaproteobacteria bacterium]|nr:YceI family protein [Zetaproteobacteria bacterium]